MNHITAINLLDHLLTPTITLKNDTLCSLAYYQHHDLASITALEAGASNHGWVENNIASSLSSSHHCLGLMCEGEWIAHAVFSLAADEAELLILSVAKAWQGKGVATAFLSAIFPCLAHYAREVFLEVRESNSAAITLYDQLGFNQLGVRPNYYPPVISNQSSGQPSSKKEDALIFGLNIFVD